MSNLNKHLALIKQIIQKLFFSTRGQKGCCPGDQSLTPEKVQSLGFGILRRKDKDGRAEHFSYRQQTPQKDQNQLWKHHF